MKSIVARFVLAAVPVAACAGVALLVFPTRRPLVLELLLLALGALAILALVRAALVRHGVRASSFERALRPARAAPARPAELASLERRVELAVAGAADLHFRLRPVLQEIAAERLARRGIDVGREPERAERTLGSEAWSLLRPDRPRPDDPFAPGWPRDRLRAVVDAIEAI